MQGRSLWRHNVDQTAGHLVVFIQQGINIDVRHDQKLCSCVYLVTGPLCMSACTRWSATTPQSFGSGQRTSSAAALESDQTSLHKLVR